MEPDYKHILKYLNRVNSQHGGRLKFLCGYEAGCLGYSLYHELTSHGVDCVILVDLSRKVQSENTQKDMRG